VLKKDFYYQTLEDVFQVDL